MPHTIPWTRQELDRLPDDGNRYEILDGELLVTPAPSDVHQEIVAWVAEHLFAFVAEHRLGRIHFPRSVIVAGGSQLEPDLMVRPIAPLLGWEKAPLPILVVEVTSQTTRQRDLIRKRDFYLAAGVSEYWAIDRHERALMRFTAGATEKVTSILRWCPNDIRPALEIDVAALFIACMPE